MKPHKPRSLDRHPTLSLKLLSADGVLFECKDRPLRTFADLEEVLKVLRHKL